MNLIERPPGLGSTRFREVLRQALRGHFGMALAGLYWFATRRRVRGWSRLMIAASNAPYNYSHWIAVGERRAMSQYIAQSPARHFSVQPLIVAFAGTDASDIRRSLASLRSAFGNRIPIFCTSDAEGCATIPPEARGTLKDLARYCSACSRSPWLLPVLAGDCVSSVLPSALERTSASSSLIYWDEDRLGENLREDPWVKPTWDPVLFGVTGGIAGSSAIDVQAAKSIDHPIDDERSFARAMMNLAVEGSVSPEHVPLILTHRSPANALRLDVPPAITPSKPGPHWPSVSIIIPTKDRADLLSVCLAGLKRTSYPGQLEIIIVDNGSTQPAALRLLEQLQSEKTVCLLRDARSFNFSRLINGAAKQATGEFLCLMNNDVEATDREWLKKLVIWAHDESIGAVGPMLLYPSGRIQHAGVAIGLGRAAGHVQKGIDPSEKQFRTWHAATRKVSAVTAAVLVIRKSRFWQVGGFDESLAVAFNDVDFCLRVQAAGFHNLYVADVRLVHRESESRGDDRKRKNIQRYARELKELQNRWKTPCYDDPHFSPLFSRLVERCVLIP